MILMSTAQGEEHGLVVSLPNSVKEKDAYQNVPEARKAELEKKRKEDGKQVKVTYLSTDEMNGKLDRVPYCKYAGESIQIWTLLHGYDYTMPRGLVDQINESSMPQRDTNESHKGEVRDRRPKKQHRLIPAGW